MPDTKALLRKKVKVGVRGALLQNRAVGNHSAELSPSLC